MENLDFIQSEMLTHVPVCTHAKPKRVLVINGGRRIQNELDKHSIIEEVIHIDGFNVIEELQKLGAKKFDIAIVRSNEFTNNKEFWIELTKLLDSKGVVSIIMSNIITQKEKAKEELLLAGKIYPIVMPYRYDRAIDNDKVVSEYLMLASRFYHPTADINLQRADLTDGYAYYNSDIAIAAFSVPTFVYKEYLGVIKR